MAENPSGYTIFCDDIRQELGGKLSYIGVYSSILYLSGGFPATLPKFGFSIHYIQPGRRPKTPIDIMIYLPGDTKNKPSIKLSIPLDTIESAEIPDDHAERLFHAAAVVPMTGLQLKSPGLIVVRARCEKKTKKIGGLRIETAEK